MFAIGLMLVIILLDIGIRLEVILFRKLIHSNVEKSISRHPKIIECPYGTDTEPIMDVDYDV